MKFHPNTKVYGDLSFRGKCFDEDTEVMAIVNQVRLKYPDVIVLHIKNEGPRKGKDFRQLDKDKAMGFIQGASDLVFYGNPTLVMEVKIKDHTKARWKPNQEEFLHRAERNGCMAVVALGAVAGLEAVEDWLKLRK